MGVKDVSDAEFNEIINEERVIVKYYASWCGICKTFAPKFKRLSNDPKFEGITFLEVLAEKNPKARIAAGVVSLPFIATFSKGGLIGKISSNKEEDTLALLDDLQMSASS